MPPVDARVPVAQPPTPRVARRDELEVMADALVPLGLAPDGLPLLIEVRRARSATELVLDALGQPDRLPPAVAAAMAQLDTELTLAARAAGMCDLEGARCYRSRRAVGELLGDTLFVRALGGHSPIAESELPAVAAVPSAPSSVAMVQTAPVTIMKAPIGARRHLIIPLRTGPAMLIDAGDGPATVSPELISPLRFEDVRAMPSARLLARGADGAVVADGSLHDPAWVKASMRRAIAAEWSVSATDIGRQIAQLARAVGALHDEGRVHADVKPGNAVITASGAIAIDPIGIVAGQVSPGATPGWAAPEQILGKPVRPATDVYPLGLMVAKLVGAVVYGEERLFVVPLERGERRRVRLLSNHDVYLDPSIELPAPVRAAWESLVRAAVEFHPDERTASAHQLADRIDELLERAPLTSRLRLAAGPGRLAQVDHDGDAAAWVVLDERSPCS